MKRIQFVIILLAGYCLLYAMEIPFSTVPVKSDANLITNLVRIDPDDQKAESLPTQVWLWYDENNLYARFEAAIDSTLTIGQPSARDANSRCDFLYINLITNPMSHSGYYYAATPSGSLEDGTLSLSNGDWSNWDSSYSYTNSITDTLWAVVFTIPFKDLRFDAEPPYKWKIVVTRFHDNNLNNYAFPYYRSKETGNFYDKALKLELTHKINRHSNWKLRPYYVKSYDLVQKTTTFDPDNIGLDISFNPNTRTKLKFTLNPDFTDVPPDDATDIYNEKYPTYYSENRFFFIEDIDAFGVNDEMFYTRNIVQPQFAIKFTGNTDIWTYGYLGAKDRKITDSGETVNPDDYYQLLAVQRKTAKYTAHLASASRMNSGYYNHFILGDWDWEFLKNMHIGTFHTYTQKHADAEDIKKQGLYQWIYLDLNPGNWNIYASYTNLQKDVALDMGYLNETGLENYSLSTTWRSAPKERFVKSVTVLNSLGYGNKLEANRPFDYIAGNSSVIIGFLPRFSSGLTLTRGQSVYLGKEHDVYSGLLQCNHSKWSIFRPSLAALTGKIIVYSLNQTKDYYFVKAGFSSSFKKRLSGYISVTHYDYDYNKLNYIYTPTDTLLLRLDNSYEIANLSLDYNFSNRMSLKNGLGISTYKTGSRYSNLTFYSNFRYEFKKDCFLYLGYKTGQAQDEPSTLNDLTGHFNRNSASAYLKLSLTL